MKSILDRITREELMSRIQLLNEHSQAQWGVMNVFQMVRHCVLCEELYLGKKKYKRVFLGRLFGRKALYNLIKDDKPLKQNEPTSSLFKVRETNGDFPKEKLKWLSLVEQYGQYGDGIMIHWFFGKMNRDQVGYFVYKHTDHHLRQFNC